MNSVDYVAYEAILGPAHIDTSEDPPVLLPPGEGLLAGVLGKAHADRQPVAIMGAGGFPVPDPAPDSLLLSTKALTSVTIDTGDFVTIAEAGAAAVHVAKEAARAGFGLPLDTLYASKATIGGAFTAGVFGLSSYRAFDFRSAVIGVRAVTAAGEIITGGGRTVKNVTGYDISRFLAGTMGLFGVVFELTVKLAPVPKARRVVIAEFPGDTRLSGVIRAIGSGVRHVSMFEIISSGADERIVCAVSVEGLESIVRESIDEIVGMFGSAGSSNVRETGFAEYATDRGEASATITGDGLCTISVPPSSAGYFFDSIRSMSRSMPVIAHPSAGKFHVVCPDDGDIVRKLTESSLALGGKKPVEGARLRSEGIGDLFTDPEQDVIRALKRELDPGNLLNPHVLM